MPIRIPVALLLTAALIACQPTATPVATALPADLEGLPLSPTMAREIRTELASLDSAEAKRLCTEDEIAFVRASAILMAVYLGEDETAPWSPRQTAKVEGLRARWQALGGDARDGSAKCHQLPSMVL